MKKSIFILFFQLVQIFEPHSMSQVHGFDWFKGMDMDAPLDNKEFYGLHKQVLSMCRNF